MVLMLTVIQLIGIKICSESGRRVNGEYLGENHACIHQIDCSSLPHRVGWRKQGTDNLVNMNLFRSEHIRWRKVYRIILHICNTCICLNSMKSHFNSI